MHARDATCCSSGYDDGDCCKASCVSAKYACGVEAPFKCLDPKYLEDPEQNPETSSSYKNLCEDDLAGNGYCDTDNNSEECGMFSRQTVQLL